MLIPGGSIENDSTVRRAMARQAQEVHAMIRATLASMAGPEVAEGLRIQYGGSVKPDNAAELWPRCDGAIVGTAAKRGGRVEAAVDLDRVKALRKACK